MPSFPNFFDLFKTDLLRHFRLFSLKVGRFYYGYFFVFAFDFDSRAAGVFPFRAMCGRT